MPTLIGDTFTGNDYGSINVDDDGSEPTLQVSAPSIAIDTGKTISDVTLDYQGTMRPQGSAYDMGAFEAPFTEPIIAGPVGTSVSGVSIE
jgi:hypothetical protein